MSASWIVWPHVSCHRKALTGWPTYNDVRRHHRDGLLQVVDIAADDVRPDVRPIRGNRIRIDVVRPDRTKASLDETQVESSGAGVKGDESFRRIAHAAKLHAVSDEIETP